MTLERPNNYMNATARHVDERSDTSRERSAMGEDPTSSRTLPECKGTRKHTVAIVGAGLSGLQCAAALIHSGVRVTVFEARDRIGGRVHQVTSGGHLVDVGANWIHDPNDNVIMDIARRTDTVLWPRQQDFAIFGCDGQRRSEQDAIQLKQAATDLLGQAYQYSFRHGDDIDPNTSMMDFVREHALKQHPSHSDFLKDLLNEAERLGQWDGSPARLLSLKHSGQDIEARGTDCFVANTYKSILAHIARPALESNVVRLGTEVTKVIRYSSGTANKVAIELANGSREIFDHVVVTSPLGWLKKHHQSFFSPALSPAISAAIEQIGYGNLEKLYITFPSAFWLPSHPATTHFHHPLSLPNAACPGNNVIISLAHVQPVANAHPTLLFYIHGPYAAQITSTLSALPPDDKAYYTTVDSFAYPFYSQLPNFSPLDSSCKPTACLCSMWGEDSWAGNGSYSNYQIGLTDLKGSIEAFRAAGVQDGGNVWFAGEHTADPLRQGTTAGAYLSGERVAREICLLRG